MNVEAIRSQILDAWQTSRPLPAEAIGYPGEGLHLERDAVVQFFAGKSWEEISWNELLKYKGDCSACLSFMSPEAYRYYLPSYMLVALDHYLESDVSADSAWWSLAPPTDPMLNQYWVDRVVGFSQAQKEAILSFLQFILSEHSSDYASSIEYIHNAVAYWKNAL
jgi:hypothetical protein